MTSRYLLCLMETGNSAPWPAVSALVFCNCKQMMDRQPSKIVTKTLYTGSDKPRYQDTDGHNKHFVTQCDAVSRKQTLHHCVSFIPIIVIVINLTK